MSRRKPPGRVAVTAAELQDVAGKRTGLRLRSVGQPDDLIARLPLPIKDAIKRYLVPLLTFPTIGPFFAISNALLRVRSGRLRQLVFDGLGVNASTSVLYTDMGGERFLIYRKDHVISKSLFSFGQFEFEKFEIAIQLLKESGIYNGKPKLLIDVGANIGPLCIPAVARGFVERAIAIEPEPDNCRLLRANLALNGLTGSIAVHESACGMRDGATAELALSADNFGAHRIQQKTDDPNDQKDHPTIHVQSNRLDTLCPYAPGQNPLIWMDTEGYEGYVLAGSRIWLDALTPIVMELHGANVNQSFELTKTSLSGYGGFYDLAAPGTFHPIKDLEAFFARFPKEHHTDILVLGMHAW